MESLAEPFREIARNCNGDNGRPRWSATEIVHWLRSRNDEAVVASISGRVCLATQSQVETGVVCNRAGADRRRSDHDCQPAEESDNCSCAGNAGVSREAEGAGAASRPTRIGAPGRAACAGADQTFRAGARIAATPSCGRYAGAGCSSGASGDPLQGPANHSRKSDKEYNYPDAVASCPRSTARSIIPWISSGSPHRRSFKKSCVPSIWMSSAAKAAKGHQGAEETLGIVPHAA